MHDKGCVRGCSFLWPMVLLCHGILHGSTGAGGMNALCEVWPEWLQACDCAPQMLHALRQGTSAPHYGCLSATPCRTCCCRTAWSSCRPPGHMQPACEHRAIQRPFRARVEAAEERLKGFWAGEQERQQWACTSSTFQQCATRWLTSKLQDKVAVQQLQHAAVTSLAALHKECWNEGPAHKTPPTWM